MKRPLHANCAACPRREQQPVLPDPNFVATRVWITDQPTQQDERSGHLLSGNTGITLSRVWKAACDAKGVEIPRTYIHVTAAALCPAIEQKDKKELRRAIECCRPRLFHELRQLNSNAGVLALGTDVHFALFGETERASEYQGFTLKFDPEKEP